MILNQNSLVKKDIVALIRSTTLCLILPELLLLVTGYFLFVSGWWLPIVPAGLSLLVSTIIVGNYYNQNQKKLAYIDDLTQIANRRLFEQFLKQQWHQYRNKARHISLILCDIDYFKKYNDTYGHQAGDLCLRRVAQGINQAARVHDLAARYGGEEFAIILPNTDSQSAMIVAQRVCNIIRSLEIEHESSLISDHVSLSCGVASTSMDNIADSNNLIVIC